MSATFSAGADYRLVVTGTGGLVARHTGRILVIPDLSTGAPRHAAALVNLCLDDTMVDGTVVLRRAAYLLTDPDALDAPGFCFLVTAGSHGLARLLAHGDVQVFSRSDSALVTPADRATWIERLLPDIDGMSVSAVGKPSEHQLSGAPWLDLRDGVVAGSVATVLSREQQPAGREVDGPAQRSNQRPTSLARPVAPVVPQHAEVGSSPGAEGKRTLTRPVIPPVPSFEAVQLIPEVADLVPRPLPTAAEPAQDDPGLVMVEGIVCSRGHFNDPDAAFCTVCGISMVQRTHEYVSGPRPPLGVLLFDDGAAFTVDGNYVIGREPDFDPAVATGSARPLVLADPQNSVSRVHAELRADGWRVTLEDRGSANGTCVAAPGSDDWQPLAPGRRVELTPGHQVRFGDRSAVYESHVRQR